jgi:hypothetical protein
LRFLFLQTPITSYNFYSSVTVKEKGRNLIENDDEYAKKKEQQELFTYITRCWMENNNTLFGSLFGRDSRQSPILGSLPFPSS